MNHLHHYHNYWRILRNHQMNYRDHRDQNNDHHGVRNGELVFLHKLPSRWLAHEHECVHCKFSLNVMINIGLRSYMNNIVFKVFHLNNEIKVKYMNYKIYHWKL